jgi:hypothetical protein
MNKRIEKFLVWACILQVLGLIATYALPGIANYLLMEKGIHSGLLISMQSSFILICMLPLRFVCGAWLKSESDRIGTSPWVWFWTGFVFQLIGVVAFYAYLTFNRTRKAQPVDGGQRR